MMLQRDDILQVRSPMLNFHVLRDSSGLYLIDAGFIGGCSLLKHTIHRRGWDKELIRGIIVTHGHIDHILNVAAIAQETGAWIAAPRLDAEHIAGKPRYRGLARFTGFLESVARAVLRFRPFAPSRWLDDRDLIDVWHGLRAVHLPGHTRGHMGFYCEKLRLMFTADLFASYRGFTHFPPAIFNCDSQQILQSAKAALNFDLSGVIPNHCDSATPEEHLRRLRKLQSDSESV
jgi:glyoxylase-like metal-dependent hydrolase (beta-lactamase superfamily II)